MKLTNQQLDAIIEEINAQRMLKDNELIDKELKSMVLTERQEEYLKKWSQYNESKEALESLRKEMTEIGESLQIPSYLNYTIDKPSIMVKFAKANLSDKVKGTLSPDEIVSLKRGLILEGISKDFDVKEFIKKYI